MGWLIRCNTAASRVFSRKACSSCCIERRRFYSIVSGRSPYLPALCSRGSGPGPRCGVTRGGSPVLFASPARKPTLERGSLKRLDHDSSHPLRQDTVEAAFRHFLVMLHGPPQLGESHPRQPVRQARLSNHRMLASGDLVRTETHVPREVSFLDHSDRHRL